MGKFITLREEFESETGAHPFADQHYIEWLEKVVEKQRQVKNCSIPVVVCSACGAKDSIHWDKREIGIDDKLGSYLDLTFNYCDQCGTVTDVHLS